MQSLAKERPSLAKTYTIGNSVLGQNLQVVLEMFGQHYFHNNRDNQDLEFNQVIRVTAGADKERKAGKPRIRLVANMHGQI